MKLELIEEVAGVRIGVHRWSDADETTGGTELYASIDGQTWGEIVDYAAIHDLTGVTEISVTWVTDA